MTASPEPEPSGVNLSAQGDVHIGGDVIGRDKIVQNQVAHGQYVLQIGNVNGGVVNIQPGQPAVRARPAPVFLRPRPARNLIGREAEITIALDEARNAVPVEFYGEPGLGKTMLLRRLAHPDDSTPFPDGVVHLSALNQPLDDLLQSLFDAFYESNPPTVVTLAEIQHGLQNKRALILVDDVAYSRDEVETLLNVAPNCAFILASTARTLWGEGRALALPGLPPDEAVALIERELGKDLPEPEEAVAEKLAAALEGRPLYLLQAAALVREKGETLESVAQKIAAGLGAAVTATQTHALNTLSHQEAQVLAVLTPMNGVPVPAAHVAAITGLPDAGQVLEGLFRRGVVERHSPRYSLRTQQIEEALRQRSSDDALTEKTLRHFIEWARGKPSPDEVLEALAPMQALVAWAANTGHHAEAVQLARLTEAPLILLGRWAAWKKLLETALGAARASGDRRSEGYFLHQLGSRALCRGEETLARELLEQALRIRQAIGDAAGAELTAANLARLGPLVVPPSLPARPAPQFGAWVMPAAIAALMTTAAIVGLSVFNGFGFGAAPTATPTFTEAASATAVPPTLTPLPSATASATATRTASATITPSPTATATGTDTSTPTVTRTATRRPRPTSTPTLIPTLTRGPLVINFSADSATVAPEQCTTLRWSVENANAIYLYGGEYGGLPGFGVVGNDTRPACPAEEETYTLRVLRDGEVFERSVVVTVLFPTPTPDFAPPPVPTPLAPSGFAELGCPVATVTLSWSPVSDDSGILQYEWLMEYAPDYETYAPFTSGATVGTSASFSPPGCGAYRWQVRAVDGAGNPSDYSPFADFYMTDFATR